MTPQEEKELNHLSHEITRLITRVDYHEKEMVENKRVSDGRFAKLEAKLDSLADSINSIKTDVKELMIKLGFWGLVGMFALQAIGKHFGWL